MPTSRTGKRTSKRGFTLIELVVSVLIMATGLLLLLVSIRQGLQTGQTALRDLEDSIQAGNAAGAGLAGLAAEGEESETAAWEASVEQPRPDLKFTRISPARRESGPIVWISTLEPVEKETGTETGEGTGGRAESPKP